MFAANFSLKRISTTRLQLFSPISTFVQARFQRAEVAQPRSTSQVTEDEALPFDQIPGPRGNKYATVLEFYRESDGFTKVYKLWKKLFEEYGPIFKDHVTDAIPVVHVMEPEDFETVFRAEGKYPDRGPGVEVLTKIRTRREQPIDLVNLKDEEWHRVRQAMAPKMMRPKVLEENIDNFNSVTKDAVERLDKIRGTSGQDGEIPDLEGELKKWATESVGTLVFDTRIGLYSDPTNEEAVKFIQAIDDMFMCLHVFIFGFVERNLWPYVDTPSVRKLSKSLDIQTEIGMKLIKQKVKELEEMAKRDDNSQESQVVPLLTYLLAKKELTPDEICSNAITMFAAGVDTTAYATLWLLYHLARNPTIQEKLHQEIYNILGKDGDVTAGSLAKLSYLKACGKESARMTPAIAGNRRILDKDVILSGYLVPAKTIVNLEFYTTGCSEKYFDSASQYKPERWLRENKKDINPFAFLPFGFGPRMCIGNRIADLEMHLLVAKIIQRFRLEYHHEPLEMFQKLSTVPEKPVKIKFTERF